MPGQCKQSFTEQVRHKVSEALRPFFFASAGEDSGDHLVEVVRRDPVVATWFIKLSTMFSILGSMVATASCVVFFSLYWNRCGNCGRPLRWWLVGQVGLQMIQLPVRAVLLSSVRAVDRANWTIEACIMSLTASPAWHISKIVSLLLYGWFVLGVVWWMHSSDCEDCPGITTLTASVLLLSAARTGVTCLILRGLFSPPPQVTVQVSAPKVESATRDQIRVLPLVRVVPPSAVSNDGPLRRSSRANPEESVGNAPHFSTCVSGDSCAVCLCEFEQDQWTRRLPCCHHFHSGCIERWLLQNKKCPLCMHPIDQAHHIARPKSH